MPEQNILDISFPYCHDNGIVIWTQDRNKNVKIECESVRYDCHAYGQSWGLFRSGQDSSEPPLWQFPKEPTSSEVFNAVRSVHNKVVKKRSSITIPSRQESQNDNGVLFLLAGSEMYGQLQVLETMNQINLLAGGKTKITHPLDGTKELKAIYLKSQEDVQKIRQYMSSNGIGLVPADLIRGLGASFIDAELMNKGKDFYICSPDKATTYAKMPSTSEINECYRAMMSQEQEQKQETVAEQKNLFVIEPKPVDEEEQTNTVAPS